MSLIWIGMGLFTWYLMAREAKKKDEFTYQYSILLGWSALFFWPLSFLMLIMYTVTKDA